METQAINGEREKTIHALTLVDSGRNAVFLQAKLLNSILGSTFNVAAQIYATKGLDKWSSLREILSSQAPVIYHYASFDPYALLFARRQKSIFVYHNQTPARYYFRWRPQATLLVLITNMQLCLFPKDMQWVAVSEFNRQRLLEFGFKRVTVCPCIVTRKETDSTSDKTEEPSVLFVGRIAPNKNCIELLSQVSNAARSLHRRVTLRIVGDIESGCLYGKAFRKQILHHLSEPWLEIQWYTAIVSQEELDALYASSWVYVSTSLHEGFGLPVCEAIARGTPALYVECGGTESVLGRHGMVPRSESKRFWEYLAKLLESNSTREELLTAQKGYVSKYVAPAIEETIRSIYAPLIGF
jgi:glycosyltransferase involved in cell wall biosynthesis